MDIIDAIDQATGCHQCGGPLGKSPSSLFCGEACQATWQAARVGVAPVMFPIMHSMEVSSGPSTAWSTASGQQILDDLHRWAMVYGQAHLHVRPADPT